uniref:Uncharacterized protein n=1 Tax=Anguilla anguilla TaxID=7936 RepID=A0A0E9QEB7_ANGAN
MLRTGRGNRHVALSPGVLGILGCIGCTGNCDILASSNLNTVGGVAFNFIKIVDCNIDGGAVVMKGQVRGLADVQVAVVSRHVGQREFSILAF